MTKVRSKRILSIVLGAAIVLMFGFADSVFAQNGPSSGDNAYSYIYIGDGDSEYYVYCFDDDQELSAPTGVSYSKKTNTLTLKKYSAKDAIITANEMGDDFKVKVVGTCNIGALNVWGFGYGGSLSLTGTGTLTINKDKKNDNAILLNAEASKSKLVVAKTLNVNAYAPSKKSAFFVSATTLSKNGISIKGKVTTKNKIKKSKTTVNVTEKVKLTYETMTVEGNFSVLKNANGKKFALYTSSVDGVRVYSIYSIVKQSDGTYKGTLVSGQKDLKEIPSKYKHVTKTTKYYDFCTSASTLKIKAK